VSFARPFKEQFGRSAVKGKAHDEGKNDNRIHEVEYVVNEDKGEYFKKYFDAFFGRHLRIKEPRKALALHKTPTTNT